MQESSPVIVYPASFPSNTDRRPVVLQQTISKPPTFSGESPVKPGDATYDEWRYEVRMLMAEDNSYPPSYVRKSLRGEARRLTMRCQSLKEVLKKLDTFYSSVDDGVVLLQTFYSCRQNKDENARSFFYHLEDLLHQARDKGEIGDQSDDRLRDVFWKGLRDANIKASLHHHYESKIAPERLLRLVREQEDHSEVPPKQRNVTVHQQATLPTPSQTTPASPTPKPSQPKTKENDEWICHRCSLPGHIGKGCKNFHLWDGNKAVASGALSSQHLNGRRQFASLTHFAFPLLSLQVHRQMPFRKHY
ncbi:uncharacterized protein LOC117109064 [Anneissia japonica]|uniref:uncharacterized protein LOC117109064 n=1 Tax=Anneissia japonica TaxID=1529436 RepID=UPI00142558C3|nr:uncharacterized protein LOC117109064 [Anneissia japonica]